MADWFLTGSDFGFLAEVVAAFVAYGLGLGAIVSMLALGIWFVVQLIKF